MNDSLRIGVGPTLFAFALFWTSFWAIAHRYNPHMPPERRGGWRAALIVGPIFTALAIDVLTTDTYPSFTEQRRAREWTRAQEFETVEGPIAGFRRDAGKNATTHFRVGANDFSYNAMLSKRGGFQGQFTAPAPPERKDGLQVRVAHHDGRILRIEVAGLAPEQEGANHR